MVTGHVFAMSSDHINKGFITTKVPTWEIHFPSVIPAKRRLCRPIVNMIWQLACKCLKTSKAHSQSPQQPLVSQPRGTGAQRAQYSSGLYRPGQIRDRDWVGLGHDRHLAQNCGLCKVNRNLVIRLLS